MQMLITQATFFAYSPLQISAHCTNSYRTRALGTPKVRLTSQSFVVFCQRLIIDKNLFRAPISSFSAHFNGLKTTYVCKKLSKMVPNLAKESNANFEHLPIDMNVH